VNFSLAQSQIIALVNPLGQVVDAVDVLPQGLDVSSGSNPDGDPAVFNLYAASPRHSNNQIWAQPPLRRPMDGAILLNFTGLAFAPHRILAANTLQQPAWSNLAALVADGVGSFAWTDTNASTQPERFYRAVSP
jgi:hypothetical protein